MDDCIKSFSSIIMRTFLELARERYSVRSFASLPIEEEKLHLILQAGQIAPTAVNYQPQKIYVLQSENALYKIRSITKNSYNAPTVLLICYDERISWKSHFVKEYNSGEMDASIVCTHMMLEAAELGIGSCWVLLFDPALVQKEFDLPQFIHPICLLPIGYPSEQSKPYAPWHDTFRSLSETVEYL